MNFRSRAKELSSNKQCATVAEERKQKLNTRGKEGERSANVLVKEVAPLHQIEVHGCLIRVSVSSREMFKQNIDGHGRGLHSKHTKNSRESTSAAAPKAGAPGDWGRRGPKAPGRQRGFHCGPHRGRLPAAPALPPPPPPSVSRDAEKLCTSRKPRGRCPVEVVVTGSRRSSHVGPCSRDMEEVADGSQGRSHMQRLPEGWTTRAPLPGWHPRFSLFLPGPADSPALFISLDPGLILHQTKSIGWCLYCPVPRRNKTHSRLGVAGCPQPRCGIHRCSLH
ncbi:uncharacterized protein LOC117284490 [Fukomys damarensis]|uniref:uncharacterized protein LOC117284490 n=1 Tax=Fukomys damarensis TaxID=885580 RepID=UPI001455C61F|nr:uncharacterized protein LOC117284490 [Fukomys damarensis]